MPKISVGYIVALVEVALFAGLGLFAVYLLVVGNG